MYNARSIYRIKGGRIQLLDIGLLKLHLKWFQLNSRLRFFLFFRFPCCWSPSQKITSKPFLSDIKRLKCCQSLIPNDLKDFLFTFLWRGYAQNNSAWLRNFQLQTLTSCLTAQHRGSIRASYPAIPGLILGVHNFFQIQYCWDLSTAALLREWTVQKA